MERVPDHRRGSKSKLRLSVRRKKGKNISKFNAARRADLPCLTKEICSLNLPVEESGSDSADASGREFQEQTSFCSTVTDTKIVIDGFRIVYLQKFIDSLKKLSDHAPQFGCSLRNMHISKEFRNGFESKITFECSMCGFTKMISTCEEDEERLDINTSAVTAIMNVGGGYTQLKNITGAMDIPYFGFRLYKKLHDKICNAWETVAWDSMKQAGEREARMALQCGSVDANGTPMITVVCDGSWAKRSYRGGGNYNSLSGAAAIVGLKTGNILYLGVKNKYCCVCQRAENKGEEVPEHTCYKNWNSSSTAMEANIIAEGFSTSLQTHNLIYNKMIADGDSSCYKKILDTRPYGRHTVEKIECTNHLLRNYCNKLKEIFKSKGIPGMLRTKLQQNILRCRTAVVKAVHYRKKERLSEEEKIRNLRKDIINSISHIFGEHKGCAELNYFCQKSTPDEENLMNDFRTLGIEEKIMGVVRYLAGHSKSLLEFVNTNTVEQFNAIIAQKTGGKRVNYSLRRCYQGRCFSAVVSRNTTQPLHSIHKHLTGGHSPGKYVKRIETRRKYLQIKKKRLFSKTKSGEDHEYGEKCQKPDLDVERFDELKSEFLGTLLKTDEEYKEIEAKTQLQSESLLWKRYRRELLTASNFGKICKMRPTTNVASTIEHLLYKDFFSKASAWGKNNEDRAKRSLESRFNFEIRDSGLMINRNWPFLGASPDGIEVESGSLVEIKCPFTARNLTIKEAVSKQIIKYLEPEGNSYTLKKSHNYYYQVQGQLNIADKEKCIFSIWTLQDLIYFEINIDKEFFQSSMLPKLTNFYYNCLLPEILDPRHTRGMEIRNPDYIMQAQSKMQQQRNKK